MRRSYPQAASDKQGRGATPRTWARRPAPGPQPPSRPILPSQHSGTTLRTQRCLPLTPKGRGPTWEPRPRAKNRSGEGQRVAGDRQLLVGREDVDCHGRVGSGDDARLAGADLVRLDVDLDAEGSEGLGQLAAHCCVVFANDGSEGDDGTTQLREGCVSVSYSLVKSEEAISMSPIKQ